MTSFKLAYVIFDHAIKALRRDPRFRDVTWDEFDLLLADPRDDAARLLQGELRVRRAHFDDGGES
jgi:hypothetical protein